MDNVKGSNPKSPWGIVWLAIFLGLAAWYHVAEMYGWRFWKWPWLVWLRLRP